MITLLVLIPQLSNRVVYTCRSDIQVVLFVCGSGYMSPEYALDGQFSTKSDIFSFGVVLLEIISGKKNTGFYQYKGTLSLLGYVCFILCSQFFLSPLGIFITGLILIRLGNCGQRTSCWI